MLNIILNGYLGRMGKTITALAASMPDMQIVAGIDSGAGEGGAESKATPIPVFKTIEDCNIKGDVIIDFSHVSAIPEVLAYAKAQNTPILVATTGLSDKEKDLLRETALSVAVFHSANMSLGINCLAQLMEKLVPPLEQDFHIEIVEKHHAMKKDSPSGTALLLADAINASCNEKKEYIYGREGFTDNCPKSQMGIHAVRGGTIPGEHTILFSGPDEVIEITHRAFSREIFARGALKAATFLRGKSPGLYSMKNIF